MAKKLLKDQLPTEIKNDYINAKKFSADDLVNLVDHADYLFKNKYKARKKYKDIQDISTQHKWKNVGRKFIGYFTTFDSFVRELEDYQGVPIEALVEVPVSMIFSTSTFNRVYYIDLGKCVNNLDLRKGYDSNSAHAKGVLFSHPKLGPIVISVVGQHCTIMDYLVNGEDATIQMFIVAEGNWQDGGFDMKSSATLHHTDSNIRKNQTRDDRLLTSWRSGTDEESKWKVSLLQHLGFNINEQFKGTNQHGLKFIDVTSTNYIFDYVKEWDLSTMELANELVRSAYPKEKAFNSQFLGLIGRMYYYFNDTLSQVRVGNGDLIWEFVHAQSNVGALKQRDAVMFNDDDVYVHLAILCGKFNGYINHKYDRRAAIGTATFAGAVGEDNIPLNLTKLLEI